MSNNKVKKVEVCDCNAQVQWKPDFVWSESIEMACNEKPCPVCGMFPWYEEQPLPIHEYKGEYPILSTTEAGNVCLWHSRLSMAVIKLGVGSGWELGEQFTLPQGEDQLQRWGRGSCVVLTDPVTIQF